MKPKSKTIKEEELFVPNTYLKSSSEDSTQHTKKIFSLDKNKALVGHPIECYVFNILYRNLVRLELQLLLSY
jgi:hypothetical protein